jgi:hypothetical protein
MYANVPRSILDMLKGEPVDFIVQSAQDYRKRGLGYILLGVIASFSWIILFPFMFAFPFIEVITTGKTTITVNGVLETYTKANILTPLLFMIFPLLFSLIFIIPGLILFSKAIKYIKNKGPWYAGTNSYLIEINDSRTKHFSWNQFKSRIDTKSYADKTLDIILFLKQPEKEDNILMSNLASNTQMSVTVNGKSINKINFANQIPFLNNRVGLLRIPNGSYVFNMIRHNMNSVASSD